MLYVLIIVLVLILLALVIYQIHSENQWEKEQLILTMQASTRQENTNVSVSYNINPVSVSSNSENNEQLSDSLFAAEETPLPTSSLNHQNTQAEKNSVAASVSQTKTIQKSVSTDTKPKQVYEQLELHISEKRNTSSQPSDLEVENKRGKHHRPAISATWLPEIKSLEKEVIKLRPIEDIQKEYKHHLQTIYPDNWQHNWQQQNLPKYDMMAEKKTIELHEKDIERVRQSAKRDGAKIQLATKEAVEVIDLKKRQSKTQKNLFPSKQKTELQQISFSEIEKRLRKPLRKLARNIPQTTQVDEYQAKKYPDDKVAEWEPIKTVDEVLQETVVQQEKNSKKQELLERLQHKWQQKDDIAVSSSNAYSQSTSEPTVKNSPDDDALTTYYQFSGSDTQKTTRQDDLAQHLDKIAADDMAQQEKINRLQHKQALLEKLQHKWGHQENSQRTPIVQNNDSEAAAYSKVEALSDDDDEFSAYYHHLFTSDEQKTEQNEQNNTTQKNNTYNTSAKEEGVSWLDDFSINDGFALNDDEENKLVEKELMHWERQTQVLPEKTTELSVDAVKKKPSKFFQVANTIPPLSLLLPAQHDPNAVQSQETLLSNSITIEEKLAEYRVKVKVLDFYAGPVITRYEIQPDVGVRGNSVLNLEKDLARSLGVAAIRVVETIPGKTCMGLELPNPKRQMIRLSEIFNSDVFVNSSSKLTLALGQDIIGKPVVTDLAKAPHLLVAGTTGSGKSVGVNSMILSIIYKAQPSDVRMIMIDPKMLELSIYEGIPHLLAPVVTDMKLAANALNWCVNEMEKRYRLMSHVGVRNLAGYNQKIREAAQKGKKIGNPFSLNSRDPEPLEKLPYIVVVVDEFADLMMVAGKQIEQLIARLAQKARAAGIHLILATQRPSVDVMTGLIKANIPSRIAFQVSSKIDSRTVLDQMGAENLLGQGDMLFLQNGTNYLKRVHGAFVADSEVHAIVDYLKQFGEPEYIDEILQPEQGELNFGDTGNEGRERDVLFDQAVECITRTQKTSISSLQRYLKIGYNRAATIIDQLEAEGIISAADSSGKRSILTRISQNED